MAHIRPWKGGWRADVVRVGAPRQSRTFASKAEARRWALAIEASVEDGRARASLGLWTLGDALARYAREVSTTKRGGRWEAVRLAAMGRDAAIAGKLLRDLAASDVAAWRDRRLERVQPSSVAREFNLLRSVLEMARREWGWIHTNPARDVRRPSSPPPRDRRIDDDERDRICLALGWDGAARPVTAEQRIAVMFCVAIETAMRAGELTSLLWSQVRLRERYVQLDRTKNGDRRAVPLSSRAIALLELLPREDVRVFAVDPRSRDTLFRRARGRAGITDLHFHDTRHEAITRLARRLDVLDLARVVGTRDLRTLRIYYNATPAELAARLG